MIKIVKTTKLMVKAPSEDDEDDKDDTDKLTKAMKKMNNQTSTDLVA